MNLREHLVLRAGEFGILAGDVYDHWIRAESDKDILGDLLHPNDLFSETLTGKEIYAWYAAFSKAVKASVVAEIGVRYGYSLWAMAKTAEKAYGWDAERYIPNSNAHVRRYFSGKIDLELLTCDTQNVSRLVCEPVDVFSVDGDHSTFGALRDIDLAYQVVRPGGWILIDDIQGLYYTTEQDTAVRTAADIFIERYRLKHFFIPTYRGMYAIQK
ncbi:MAG: class I SAM-dependent methyltransferase [Patescibacteria group bacterium]|nr:class I SAM-dependent methyltransferase [Patescibacteria group bacterium]